MHHKSQSFGNKNKIKMFTKIYYLVFPIICVGNKKCKHLKITIITHVILFSYSITILFLIFKINNFTCLFLKHLFLLLLYSIIDALLNITQNHKDLDESLFLLVKKCKSSLKSIFV